VLVIGPTPPPFNGMSVATDLALQVLGKTVSVIHLDTADRRNLSNVGKVDFVNVFLAVKHAVKYLYLVLTKSPDFVYIPIAQEQLAFLRDAMFLVPARFLHKKVVIHLHGGYFDKFYRSSPRVMRWLVNYALGHSVRAVVLGDSLRNMFRGLLPQDRVRVIPNGIPDAFESNDISGDCSRPTILFLSTLMQEKGVFELIKALPGIAKDVPDMRAVFAGEWLRPQEQAAANNIIREFKMEPFVEFLGPVAPPFKHQILRAAHVFVMPTHYRNEGHPYVILEAMSAGLPIVSTAVGCIPETVLDGVNGFIIDPNNIDELIHRVVSLLSDKSLRNRMGRASRERFLGNYTLTRFAHDMHELFREINGVSPA